MSESSSVLPHSFVNRLKEIRVIREKLQKINRKKLLNSFILTVTGIPGIGKTTLLQQSKQEAEVQGADTLFFDYEKPEVRDNPVFLLQNIGDYFFKSEPDWQATIRDYEDNHGHPSQQAFYQERVIETFIKYLKLQLKQTPLLLLLDNIHRISEPEQEILEDILERFSHENRRLLVMLAGRTDIRWHSFELRRRTTALPLDPFPKKENAKLLPNPDYAVLTDQVYAVTRGYPKASALAYQWVLENFKPTDTNLSEHFKAREADLILDLFDAIFEEYILHDIDNLSTRQRLNQLLRYISPLRRIDDNLLAELLRTVDKDNYGQVNTLDARAYTRQMAAQTYLVKWDSAKQAYALDLPIRRLLSLQMNLKDKPHLLDIHIFTKKWYKREIKKVTARDPSAPQSVIYLLEYIFHYAQFWQIQGRSINLEQEIQQKIVELFEGYDLREQVHFYEEFKKDDELAEVLGDTYHRLARFVARHVEAEGQM